MDGSTVESGLVFVYQLRSFLSLDQYWKIQRSSQPLTIHVTVDKRADALLADRYNSSSHCFSLVVWSQNQIYCALLTDTILFVNVLILLFGSKNQN